MGIVKTFFFLVVIAVCNPVSLSFGLLGVSIYSKIDQLNYEKTHKKSAWADPLPNKPTHVKLIEPLSGELNSLEGKYIMLVPETIGSDTGFYDQIESHLLISYDQLEYYFFDSSRCKFKQVIYLGKKDGEITAIKSSQQETNCTDNSDLKKASIYISDGNKVNFKRVGSYLYLTYTNTRDQEQRVEKFFMQK